MHGAYPSHLDTAIHKALTPQISELYSQENQLTEGFKQEGCAVFYTINCKRRMIGKSKAM
jgi:hypothetical protein